MKIVLVPSPTLEGGRPRTHTPLGLVSLATVLNQAEGFSPTIFNLNKRPDFSDPAGIAREILALEPDVVGFSCLGGGYCLSLKIAAHCKQLQPGVCTLFGGAQPTVCAETTVRHFPQVDVVAGGEAEASIVGILRALRDPASLAAQPGVTFMDGERLHVSPPAAPIPDLDRLPLPDYGLFPDYPEGPIIPLEVGRGCPYACSFCCIRALSGRSFRLYRPERVVGLMARLHAAHPTHRFTLLQDTFNFDREWVFSFCRALRDTGLDVGWAASCRIDRLDPELLGAMAGAGCRALFFGLESASSRLQAAIGKGLRPELVEQTLIEVVRLGIEPCLSHIIGFPDETREELSLTLRQATRFRYRFPVKQQTQLHVLTPVTGSPLYREHQSRLQFDGLYSDCAIDILETPDLAWIRRFPDMFSMYYLYPLQHLTSVELTRTAFLFTVLFTLRYTCFWLWRDEAFQYPSRLLDGAGLAGLPLRHTREEDVALTDQETVIRFIHETFPDLAAGRHPLSDVMRYDLALRQCLERGPQMVSFAWDVLKFAKEAAGSAFQCFAPPPRGPVTLLFNRRGEEVQVRRLAESFSPGTPIFGAGRPV